MNLTPQTRKRINWCLHWLKDMAIFVVAFWLLSWAMLTLLTSFVDAAVHEIDVAERTSYDLQGRPAWDKYCQSVSDGERPDDLNAFSPENGECGQMAWEPSSEVAQ